MGITDDLLDSKGITELVLNMGITDDLLDSKGITDNRAGTEYGYNR